MAASPVSISLPSEQQQHHPFGAAEAPSEFEGEASRVIKVDSDDSWEQILKEANAQNAIIVAHFSAEWCAPCKFMQPAFDEMSKRWSNMIFLEVDMDERSELAAKLDVKAMPTFLFIKEESVIDKIVGANREELEKRIETLNSPC